MSCRRYKDRLIEAAAQGAFDSELQVHLQSCGACMETYQRELELFVAIDGGLRTSAGEEIPASFMPRVRAQLNHEERPVAKKLSPVMIGALAMAAAAIVLVVHDGRRTILEPEQRNPSVAQIQTQIAGNGSATTAAVQVAAPEVVGAAVHNGRRRKGAVPVGSRQTGNTATEIIVPGDQQVLLARYAERLRRGRNSVAVVRNENEPTETEPLQIEMIQIAELDVKPLAEEKDTSAQ
jgi:hypothetical protein